MCYRLRLLSCTLLLASLLAGCTPDPVYRLHTQAPDSTSFWQQGRQVVTHTVDSLEVAVAYARTTHDGHKFRLAFVNRSTRPITVDPLDIYTVVTKKLSGERQMPDQISQYDDGERISRYDDGEDEPAPSTVYYRDTLSTADTLYARNPEQELLEIDKARAREKAAAETDAAVNALFLTLDAVSEVASGPQSPGERTADAVEDTEYQLERAENRAEHRRTQVRLGRRRARWAQTALRRTTLAPGMRTSGFVIVPVEPRTYTLVLHVEGHSGGITVPFRQTHYEP